MARFLLLAALLNAGAGAAVAEIPADGWSGQLQCAISVRAPGYQDDQTHTWVLSGAPIARSDFRDYPATWTVTGAGNKTATAGPGGAGAWTRAGSDANGSITIFVPAGTTSIRVAPGQRVVTAAGGLRGTMAAAPFSNNADEWRFQYFDTPGAVSETHFNGSRTQMLNNPIGWRQPAGAQVTETCTWNFTKAGSGPPGVATTQRPAPAATAIASPVAAGNAPIANRLARTGGPRTLTLSGFTAAGSFSIVAPRTLTLSGFTAAGSFVIVAPRTVTLAGFTAAGSFTTVAPRTLSLAGFTAAGSFTAVPPRTITLIGFTGTGATAAALPVVKPGDAPAAVRKP
jgi:hypothetical protein